MKAGGDKGQFQRMCISMITHPDSNADTFTLLERWTREVPRVPVSILSNPTTLERDDLVRLKKLGADIFTVALDAVTPAIFERTRGKGVDSPHRFDKYWQVLEQSAEVFGAEKFGAHLICGMGETEHEILAVAQKIRDLGGHNHMFAFFPERGSLMEDWPAVDRGQWRRVQLARYLIDYRGVRVDAMAFDEAGRVTGFGVDEATLESVIASGTPFRTSGCPGKEDDVSACNRPYGDSSPTDILSFPFALAKRDLAKVRRQMDGDDVRNELARALDARRAGRGGCGPLGDLCRARGRAARDRSADRAVGRGLAAPRLRAHRSAALRARQGFALDGLGAGAGDRAVPPVRCRGLLRGGRPVAGRRALCRLPRRGSGRVPRRRVVDDDPVPGRAPPRRPVPPARRGAVRLVLRDLVAESA